ncbi:MAG: sulfatase family protein, partial [Thermomicrobiales bacterium]
MNRRSIIAGITGALAGLRRKTTRAARPGQPNIVVILADDQSRDSIASMPNLKKFIADEGVTFLNTIIPSPVCSPSRATLLTGRYPHQTGVLRNDGGTGGFRAWKGKGNERRNLITWLNAGGYRTALIGKYFNGYPDGQQPPRGYDYTAFASTDAQAGDGYSGKSWILTLNGRAQPGSGYRTDVLNRLAVDFIEQSPEGQPIFLWLAHKAPHGPYEPDTPYRNDFNGERVPRTPAFNEASLADKPSWLQRGPLDANEEREMDSDWRQTQQLLESVDKGIPTIINALERTRRLDNTWIFYLSDNGYFFGQHRMSAKAALYDEAAVFPIFMRGPGVQRGSIDTRVASTVDLAPTILEITGVEPTRTLAGRSLLQRPTRVAALMEVWSMRDPKRPN